MRAPINCNSYVPEAMGDLTSMKNALPPANTYLDPAILKAYVENPLAPPLHSWA